MAAAPSVTLRIDASVTGADSIAQIEAALKRLADQKIKVSNPFATLARGATTATTAIEKLITALEKVATLPVVGNPFLALQNGAASAKGPVDALNASLKDLKSSADGVKNASTVKPEPEIDKKAARIAELVGQLKGLAAAYLTVRGAQEAIKSLNDAQISGEKNQSLMRAAFGEDAGKEMQFVREQANRLGQPINEVSEAYAKLGLAAKGTNLQGEGTRQIFLGISEAATVMRLPAQTVALTFKAVEQMISKGSIAAEELTGQLGEHLPGAMQLMAKATGLSVADLKKMISTGKLSSDVLAQFAYQLRQKFAPEVDAASKSSQSSIGRMENAWLELKRQVSEDSGLSAAMNNYREAMARLFNDSGFRSFLSTLASVLSLIPTIGAGLVDAWEKGKSATIAAGGVLAQAANYVQATWNSIMPVISTAWSLMLADMQRSSALFLQKFAESIQGSWVPGADAAAKLAREAAASLEANAKVNDVEAASQRKKIDDIEKEREAKSAAIDAYVLRTIDANRRIAAAAPKKPANPDPGKPNLGGGDDKDGKKAEREYIRRMRAEDQLWNAEQDAKKSRAKATLSLESTLLDEQLASKLISQKEYNAKKAALQEAEQSDEIRYLQESAARMQKRIADKRITDEAEKDRLRADLVKLNGQIDAALTKQRELPIKLRIDDEKIAEEMRKFNAELDAKLAEAQGNLQAAMDRRFAEKRRLLTINPDLNENEKRQSAKLLDLEYSREQFALEQQQVQRRQELAGYAQQSLRDDLERGKLTTREYNEELKKLNAETVRDIQGNVDKMAVLAAKIGDPALKNAVVGLGTTIKQLKAPVNDIAKTFDEGLANGVTESLGKVGNEVRNFRDLIRETFLSLGRTLLQFAQKNLGESLAKAFGGGQAGGSGGIGDLLVKGFSSIFSGARATGGEVQAGRWYMVGERGPEPFYAPANGGILSNDDMRRAFSSAASVGPALGSAGGAMPLPSAAGANVRIINVTDPALARDAMATPEGAQIVRNHIKSNANFVRQVLA